MHFMNILTELLHKVGSLVNLKCEHVTCRLNLGILSFIWTVFGTFGTCKIEVKNEDESGQCDLCNKWNHAFYVDISFAEYEQLKLSTLQWYCLVCAKKCHFPVYPIKNSIYSYPETLLILVHKLYLPRNLINIQNRS